MQASTEATPNDQGNKQVLINSAYLGLAEILVVPITVAINALMGRYLGPVDLGYVYVASNLVRFGFLGVEWGLPSAVPALVAIDRSRAGGALATSIAWRVAAALVLMLGLLPATAMLGYSDEQRWVLAVVAVQTLVTTLSGSYMDIVRGFERMDVAAVARVATQFGLLFVVTPTLLAGGRLHSALIVQVVAQTAVLLALTVFARRLPLGPLRVSWADLRELLQRGTPFVVFGVVLALQPGIDAFYLEKYAPPEIVGCFSVAQRLVGFLLLPVTSLVGAAYPALFRLRATDEAGFQRTVQHLLGGVPLIVAPAAIGCFLYARIGVSIYGEAAYQAAVPVLSAYAPFLAMVYWTMALATVLVAAGRQKAWTIVQLLCIVNSLYLDPLLVPYFQEHYGNGGLGVVLALTLSELLMLLGAIYLMPRGMVSRDVWRRVGQAALAGAAMAAVGFALKPLPDLLGATVALMAYMGALYLLGAITREWLSSALRKVKQKLLRRLRSA